MIFKAQYLLSANSIETKKKDGWSRPWFTIRFYQCVPESKFRKEANNLADLLKKKLEK
jgi:hypothetical protein